MKTLFIECNMGIAGDMLMAALWELVEDKSKTLDEIQSMGLPDTEIHFGEKITCGIHCMKARVAIGGVEEGSDHHHHHHSHRNLSDVCSIIDSLNLSASVKEKAKSVYDIVAQAEAKAHNTDVTMVHFHEVGMLDAIADIAVCAFLMDKLNPGKIIVSPINVGSGNVKCAHGILPVPAPAAAEILRGVPFYKSDIKGELCTPTGAALVKAFATGFSDMPVMTVDKIGYGAGDKEFEQANCVRAFLGDDTEIGRDEISELVCNIDDMTAEEIGYACEKIFDAGALDVFTQPVNMKKSRPGNLLTVLCKEENKQKVIESIFKHTSTIGIREHICGRYILDRKTEKINTPFGVVRVKVASGYLTKKYKYEYEDLKRLAQDHDMSIAQVKNIADKCRK